MQNLSYSIIIGMLFKWYDFLCYTSDTALHHLFLTPLTNTLALNFNVTFHSLSPFWLTYYSQFTISQDILVMSVCNQSLGIDDRVVVLLNCIEGRVDAIPSDFTKVVHILEADHFFSHAADMLVKSYCE